MTLKDPVAGLRAIFERPGPRLVMAGVPVRMPTRYQRSPIDAAVYFAQLRGIRAVPHRVLTGQQEMQEYVDEVLSMPWPRWHTGPVWPVTVRVVPGLNENTGTALYGNGQLFLPPVTEELIVLHELAHHLVPVMTGHHGTKAPENHGGLFVAAFLDLIGAVMNPAARLVFEKCFAVEGVST